MNLFPLGKSWCRIRPPLVQRTSPHNYRGQDQTQRTEFHGATPSESEQVCCLSQASRVRTTICRDP